MMRHVVIPLAAVLAIVASNARAGKAGKCLREARQARRQCIQACTGNFQSDLVACFGPNSACAQTCFTADMTCKSVPLQALETCANDPNNSASCRAKLQSALQGCKTDTDPEACADKARLQGLECQQTCLVAQTPALDNCQDAFRMCLAGCARVMTTTSTTTTSTTTRPATSTTTTTLPPT